MMGDKKGAINGGRFQSPAHSSSESVVLPTPVVLKLEIDVETLEKLEGMREKQEED
jgi:hypothetical protein